MKYFLHIGYDGSKYRGWQWQPNVVSIQGTIEDALEKIFKKRLTVFGCGRTDAGVHASQYFMHIILENELNFDLKFILNKNLPYEIAIYDILPMEDDQHSRYDAISRSYDYFIHIHKNPILVNYSSYYDIYDLDYEAMKKAATIYARYEDFSAICKQPDKHDHTMCKVTDSRLYVNEKEGRMRFTITANRFLRGMVRLCVYFILQVGTGELSLAELEEIISTGKILDDKIPAYPNGLYLSKVVYPYLDIESPQNMCSLLKVGLEEDN